jgi:hypothetical protein
MITTSKLRELFISNKRRGEELFPELIKKLIEKTTQKKYGSLYVPVGDDINLGGFDTILKGVSKGIQYAPKGVSLWEF